jgi:pilus assembly protein Flp/PilA
MKFLQTRLAAWKRDKRGQDLIEYAMLAGFIAVVVAAFFPTQIAPSITTVFSKVSAQLASAGGG